MDVKVILQYLKARPFLPFVLRMNDGREFRIFHPEFVMTARRDVSVIVHPDDMPIHLEPVMIASLQAEKLPDS